MFPESYRWGGNVERPESGCEWDGTPINCSMLSFIVRGAQHVRIDVNVRAEGGYGLYSSLNSLVSTWRYDVYQGIHEEDSRLTRQHYESGYLDSLQELGGGYYGQLVGSFYVAYLSQFAETIISQQVQPRPMNEREGTSLADARNRALRELREDNDCRKKVAEILRRISPIHGAISTRPVSTAGGGTFSQTIDSALIDVYDFQTGTSRLLNLYDSVSVQASNQSGVRGNSTTFASTIIRQVEINRSVTVTTSRDIEFNREYFGLGLDARALHTIHEILHQYGTDIEIANAIAQISDDRQNDRTPRTFNDTPTASRYINAYLSRVCGLPTE